MATATVAVPVPATTSTGMTKLLDVPTWVMGRVSSSVTLHPLPPVPANWIPSVARSASTKPLRSMRDATSGTVPAGPSGNVTVMALVVAVTAPPERLLAASPNDHVPGVNVMTTAPVPKTPVTK